MASKEEETHIVPDTAEKQLNFILEITSGIIQSENFEDAIYSTLKCICIATDWQLAEGYVLNKKENELELITSYCSDKVDEKICTENKKKPFVKGNEFPAEVRKKQEVIWIEDIEEHQKWFHSVIFEDIGIRSAFGFSIPLTGEVLAVIVIYLQEKRKAHKEFSELIKYISEQLGLFLKQKMTEEELSELNKELEKKVEERVIELKKTNQKLEDFTKIASHDLKAPLRAVLSIADWLKKDYNDKLDEQGKEYIEQLQSKAKYMHNLIKDMLIYARAGQKDKTKQVDVAQVILEVKNNISVPEEKSIKIKYDKNMPEIRYNKIAVYQVFQNLLSNAINYMDKPEGLIEIYHKKRDNQLEFIVKDNGPGIPKAKQKRIFKPFQSDKKSKGTGLGLSIVKRIINEHGGKIWIESEEGKGTAMHFTIPEKNDTAAQETD